MASGNFESSLKHVLVHEGGYVNHPADPGGATNKGVTQRVYDGFRVKSGQAKRSVKEITDTEVSKIYKTQYWDMVRGDELPAGVDYVVFDGAVNSGVGQSVKWLQRSLPSYKGPIDGDIGAGTLGAVVSDDDNDALVNRICDRRMAFLRALKTFGTFGKGWTRRVEGVRSVGLAMASGKALPKQSFISTGNQNAVVEDARQAPGKGLADAATGSGVGAGAISATLSQLQDQLTPYSSAGGWIETVVVVLAVAATVLTIGGFAYRWYANKRKAELSDALDLQPVSK